MKLTYARTHSEHMHYYTDVLDMMPLEKGIIDLSSQLFKNLHMCLQFLCLGMNGKGIRSVYASVRGHCTVHNVHTIYLL